MRSAIIAHQSRPSETSAIPTAPSGAFARFLVTARVSSPTTSAIGCASMALTARGSAKRSIQVEAGRAATGVLGSFTPGTFDEFMPHLPSAQAVDGQVIGICAYVRLRVACQ